MRGKLIVILIVILIVRITPACAGKTASRRKSPAAAKDHPRVCGENTVDAAICDLQKGSPPRVRGKPHGYMIHAHTCRITPACAGKTLQALSRALLPQDHPRVCGENAAIMLPVSTSGGSPPRVRGKLTGNPTKAYAEKDHPRVCGENCKPRGFFEARGGSPPRVRGKHFVVAVRVDDGRITPACAGKTGSAPAQALSAKDHPRVCGENHFFGFLPQER